MWSSGQIAPYKFQEVKWHFWSTDWWTHLGDKYCVCLTDKHCSVYRKQQRLKCQLDNDENGVLLLSEPMVIV